MRSIAIESWRDVAEEAKPLMQAHWDEIGYEYPLDFDWESLSVLDDIGSIRVFTARSDGELAGYCAFTVSRHIVNRSMMCATEIGLFMDHKFRASPMTLRLMRHAETALRDEGVSIIQYASPVGNPRFASLLQHMGFRKTDEMYSKILERKTHEIAQTAP